MHLIWKRPDGFHGASPSDFVVHELGGGHSRLWLHKSDRDQYPFRIAGGWEEKEATVRLNNLVNLLPHPAASWIDYLNKLYDHSMKDDRQKFFDDLLTWLDDLDKHVKGDAWEVDILSEALRVTTTRLQEVRREFLKI